MLWWHHAAGLVNVHRFGFITTNSLKQTFNRRIVQTALDGGLHVVWALAAGGTLEDSPRYNKNRCFETFPFPVANPEQQACIRDLAEQIDTHRKRQQATLTLTGMDNVLAKIHAGEPLSAKDKTLHEQGLVSVLQTLVALGHARQESENWMAV